MTPEAAGFLDKAWRLLGHADTMLGVDLNDDAGRTAYLAAFHAAQALLFERAGKVFKTHHGVQTEFLRLTRGDARFDDELRGFLSQAYNLKTIADYETAAESAVPPERARQAVATARQFVAHLAAVIAPTGAGIHRDGGGGPRRSP